MEDGNPKSFFKFAAVLALCAFPPVGLAQAAESDPPAYSTVHDAIDAAKRTKNKELRDQIFSNLDHYPVLAPHDVNALYRQMAEYQSAYKHSEKRSDALEYSEVLERALTKCTAPELHPAVAKLLEYERKSLPPIYGGPWTTFGLEETNKESRWQSPVGDGVELLTYFN